jgi:uncharacterized protein
MEYLYRIQPTRLAMLAEGPTPQEDAAVDRHFNYLQELALQGVVSLAGRTLNTGSDSFGIVIFNAENDDLARAIMENDPAVQAGVMSARLYPFRISLSARQK